MSLSDKLQILALLLGKPQDFLADLMANPDQARDLFEELAIDQDLDVLDMEAVSMDYTTLFIGASKPLASPYASSYHGGGRLMTAPASTIIQIMTKWGIEEEETYTDLPDHICSIVELTSILYSHYEDTDEPILKEQLGEDLSTLLDILSYLDELTKATIREEKTGFYSKVLTSLQAHLYILRQKI